MTPERVQISESRVGEIKIAPPTYLERWGIYLVALLIVWILAVGTLLLYAYLRHLPALPNASSLKPEEIKSALDVHAHLREEWFAEFTPVFDLLVTKTTLPIATLLLGYLFGKSKSSN